MLLPLEGGVDGSGSWEEVVGLGLGVGEGEGLGEGEGEGLGEGEWEMVVVVVSEESLPLGGVGATLMGCEVKVEEGTGRVLQRLELALLRMEVGGEAMRGAR